MLDNFTSTAANPTYPHDALTPKSVLDQVLYDKATDDSSALFQMPGESASGLPNSTQSFYPSTSSLNLLTSKTESVRIFGDLKTANPFVVDPAPSFCITNSINHNPAVPNYESSTDGANWLNSGLLNSLWADESKTKNPWANK